MMNQHQLVNNNAGIFTFKGSVITFCCQFEKPIIKLSNATEMKITIAGQQLQPKISVAI